jgi:hypothetical protein
VKKFLLSPFTLLLGMYAWPTRRSIAERLIRNRPALADLLSEPSSVDVLRRATRRVADARDARRRRLTAGLLTVVSAATLLVPPTSDDRRSRHATGLETAQAV